MREREKLEIGEFEKRGRWEGGKFGSWVVAKLGGCEAGVVVLSDTHMYSRNLMEEKKREKDGIFSITLLGFRGLRRMPSCRSEKLPGVRGAPSAREI